MGFKPDEQTLQKLFEHENLSQHNKEVLKQFTQRMGTRGTGQATLRDYVS